MTYKFTTANREFEVSYMNKFTAEGTGIPSNEGYRVSFYTLRDGKVFGRIFNLNKRRNENKGFKSISDIEDALQAFLKDRGIESFHFTQSHIDGIAKCNPENHAAYGIATP